MVTITDKHLAYMADFPKVKGYIVDLEIVPRQDRKAYEDLIREWCKTHDRKLWPSWVLAWPETKKRLERENR